MLFLAYKIMRSGKSHKKEHSAKPITFVQAALFQIVNPKAVMMSITSMSVYTLEGDQFYLSAFLVIAIFFLMGFPSTSVWALFGTFIGKQLNNERNKKIFNYCLGGLTACAALLLIL